MPNLVSEILNNTVTGKILVDDLVVTPRSLKRTVRSWLESRRMAVFLDHNKLLPGKGERLMSCQGNPFLSVRQYGKGWVGAFASDRSPQWAPPKFVAWKNYQPFWIQLVEWLANKYKFHKTII
jgi:uncharacterized membrane protein